MRALSVCCALLVSFVLSCGTGPEGPGNLTVVDLMDLPCPVDSLVEVTEPVVRLAGDEYESVCFLLTADTAAAAGGAIAVTGMPPGVSVTTHQVTPHTRRTRGGEATMPYFIERADSVTAAPGETALVYLTFYAEPEAGPAAKMVTLDVGGAAAHFELEVRSYRLAELEDFFFGAFCGADADEISPRHMRDLEERGFDALQFFWSGTQIGFEREGDELVIDFSETDRWVENFQEAGLKGPIVWSMGNDSKSFMENRLSELFDIPLAVDGEEVEGKTMRFANIDNPRLNELVRQVMTAIRDRAREKNWPEIVFIIYDEPTERLMAEHEDRYEFIKSFWPELQIYGVTMNRIEWARDIAHMVDIFVANGDFAEISALADSMDMPFWLYGSASSRDAAANRHRYAWTAWAHDAGSSWFWAYNYGVGDLYDDFDGRLAETSARMVWPPRTEGGPLVYSASWDGMREAVDDMRYIRMLESMLDRSDSELAGRIEGELVRVRGSIPEGRAVQVLGGDAHDTVQQVEGRKYVAVLREQVAGWISELLLDEPERFKDLTR